MMKNKKAKLLCLLFSVLVLNNGSIAAQDSTPIARDTLEILPIVGDCPPMSKQYQTPLFTNNTFMLGVGTANMYDTYLSPLKYKGISFRMQYEQMRRTTWFNYNFRKQQVVDLEVAKGDNPAKNTTEYWVMLNYRLGGHYMMTVTDKLKVGVGGLGNASVGILYNRRNGNNPVSARARINIELSAMAYYRFDKLAVRWQLDSPIAGVFFSPQFGQSYYEMTLGNSINVVNFGSLHNQRALRNYISVDVPICKYTVRVGYLGEYYQTKVNNIQTHHYTNSVVIGFPINGVKTTRPKPNNEYWD